METYSAETIALLSRIDTMKQEIDALRPIRKEQEARIFQKFRLDWNYNSNSIEGNSLNYGETVAFLMEGLTAKGKPLKDHLDIKGHNEAIDFLIDLQRKDSELTEADIRALHTMILVEPYQNKAQTVDGHPTTKTIRLGEYKSSPNHVQTVTGAIHYYASVEDTPILMRELIEWYRASRSDLHPLVLSAQFHHRFVNIHPFDDGNGRMTRLISNLILMKAGFPPLIIRQDEKREYYGVLSQADAGVIEPLIQYFAERLIRSLNTYLKGARGEDISDPTDLEKEIALFVAGFDEEEVTKEPISENALIHTLQEVIPSLIKQIINQEKKIDVLFFDNKLSIKLLTINQFGKEIDTIRYISQNSNDFFEYWIPDGTLVNNVVSYYRDSFKTDRVLRIIFISEHAAFKANEGVDAIENDLIIDFSRGNFTIHFGDKSKEIKIPYFKSLNQEETNKILTEYFRSIMQSITNAVKAANETGN